MEYKIYDALPKEAFDIRVRVFVDEQGFVDEPDETDKVASHIVGYIGENAVSTCRVFIKEGTSDYILGRFAVIKEYRGKGFGRALLEKAEEHVISRDGNSLLIHSQYHARGFYEGCGYKTIGELEYEQDEPHIWMEKRFK